MTESLPNTRTTTPESGFEFVGREALEGERVLKSWGETDESQIPDVLDLDYEATIAHDVSNSEMLLKFDTADAIVQKGIMIVYPHDNENLPRSYDLAKLFSNKDAPGEITVGEVWGGFTEFGAFKNAQKKLIEDDNVSLETHTAEEPGSAERDKSGEIMTGLPIRVLGEHDPLNPDSKDIFYHGTKSEQFKLHDSRNHRQASIGTGARSGPGLYVGTKKQAEQFGNGEVIELIPSQAHMLDLGSEKNKEPLRTQFKDAYLRHFNEQSQQTVVRHFENVDPEVIEAIWSHLGELDALIDKDAVWDVAKRAVDAKKVENFGASKRLVREIASQINTAKIVGELEGVSMAEIFATFDKVNGETRIDDGIVLDIEPMLDFLTEQGVDGAFTAQRFDDGEQAAVFWKLDKIGDKDTWDKRKVKAPQDLGQNVIKQSVEVILDQNEAIQEQQLTKEQASQQLRSRRANLAADVLESQGTSLLKAQSEAERVEAGLTDHIRQIHEKARKEKRGLSPDEQKLAKGLIDTIKGQKESLAVFEARKTHV